MTTESSALATYNRSMQNAVSTLSNRAIDVNDRIDLIGQVLQVGALAITEEHAQRVHLQGKVEIFEQDNFEQGEKIGKLVNTQKKRLNVEVAKKIKKMEPLQALGCGGKAIGVATVIGFAIALPVLVSVTAAFPPSLIVTGPILAGGLSIGVAGAMAEKKADEKRWILQNYPESIYDEAIRKIANDHWDRINKESSREEARKVSSDCSSPSDDYAEWYD